MANNNCNPINKPTGSITSFTRNHYFYGKLLTVSDFQLEQDYFIDKIRLTNQLLQGKGIIDGLEITDLDFTSDTSKVTFTLSKGHAIDADGNIILVKTNTSITIDNNATDKANFYICIEYNECQQDSVPIASDDSQCEDEECCYNRVRETYKVTIQNSASPCVYGTTCESESEVDTKSIVLAVVKTNSIDDSTKDYRCTIKSNQMLQGILCNHLDTVNPHQIKHNDLPDINGVGASNSNTKNKHISNNDAKKWDSAIRTINNKNPETNGNFTINAGNNIEIKSNNNKIEISSTAVAGNYMEETSELSANASQIIEHKFEKYPNVDLYKVIETTVLTPEDVKDIAEVEGKTTTNIIRGLKAERIDVFAEKQRVSLVGLKKSKTVINKLNEDLVAHRRKPLVLSYRANMDLERAAFGDWVILPKARKTIIKIVGHCNDECLVVEHINKNKVKITNLDKKKSITIKAILTA